MIKLYLIRQVNWFKKDELRKIILDKPEMFLRITQELLDRSGVSYKNFDWNSVGLDFGNWDEEKIWALELPVLEMNISDLIWHFDVPFWPNDNEERWTVTLWDVVHENEGTNNEQKKMQKADLLYPIDIIENKGKWLVLDGLHRLAKSYKQGQEKIKVRILPRERLSEILIDDPIELPNR